MKKEIDEIIQKYKDIPEIEKIVEEVVKVEENEFYKNHKPICDVTDYKDYRRHLIQLNHDTVMMIHLFKKDIAHEFEQVWLDDNDKCFEVEYDCITDSAHQLLQQLEGYWCEAFIEALKDECDNILKDCKARNEKIVEKINNGKIQSK